MKKLLIIVILFISVCRPLWAQVAKQFGSKDCFNAPTLCNNDIITDSLVGARNKIGTVNDIPNNFVSCFNPKSEVNPFWYQFTASNNGDFEMYLNFPEDGIDFDYILFDITNTCANKTVLRCNASDLDLKYDSIGTGISTDSLNYYNADNPGNTNSWDSTYTLTAGRKYAIYIESRQLRATDGPFNITFGGTAQFKNVIAGFTYSPTLCFGKPVTFTNTSTGGNTYLWDFGDGSTSAVTNPTHNYSTAGTYKVKLKAFSQSLCVDSALSTISINVAFNPFAGNDVAICSGASTTLTATGGVSFAWSPAAGLSSTTTASTTASPPSTTTYVVTATDVNGCTGTDDVKVTVNPLPTISAGSNVTICSGQNTTLHASGGINYTWSPATGLSSTTVQNPVATPLTTTTYTVTGTDANGCQATSTVTVNVNSSPLISAGTDKTICSGLNVTLNASGAITYSWTPAAGLSSTIISNPVASPATTTNYIVSGTDNNGCTGSDTVKVSVNALPAVSGGPDQTLCSGTTATLAGSGAVSYIWSPATGLSATNIASPVASPASTITYTVTGTDANGCVNTANVKVNVNSKPVINAGSDVAICNGKSTTLGASGGVSYVWSPATGLSSTTVANPIASPSGNTIYTVTGTDANGCQNTSSVTVSVNSLPSVSAGSNVTICSGLSTTLNASGATSYVWSPATNLSSTNISNPVANPISTTVYSVTGTDVNGCQANASVTVNVNALPTISAGNAVALCSGQNTTLNASGASSYSWTPAAGLSATNISNPIASPSSTTTYTVTGTDANGCQNTASVTVTINALPTVSAGSDATICVGGNTVLNATGATSYSWSPAAGLSNPNIANPTATPGSTTLYTVTGTNAAGCQASSSVTVNVNSLPIVSAGSDVTICSSQSTTLNASGASSYLWSPAGGLSATNIAGPNAAPAATTTYTVTGTDVNGCSANASVTVNINPLPAVNAGSNVAICNGQSTALNASGAVSYNWSPSTGLSATNIVNPIASPTSTTTYTVTGVDANGCQATSSVIVTVNSIPLVSAGSDAVICNGQSTPLQATGATSYSWSPSTGLSANNIANPVANPSTTTTYIVTGTNGTGCQATSSVTVTVNPGLVISAGSNVAICSGQSTNLSASGASTYVWSPAAGLSATNISNPIANPVSTTIYHVTGTDVSGCIGTASVTVNINPLPAISAGSDVAFCKGNSTTLNATGGTTYSWSPVVGLSNPNIANPVAAPLFTTTYTVTGTDANGCQNTSSVKLTVNPLSTVDAGNDVTLCNGQSTALNASGGNTYSWTPAAGLSSTTIPNPTANPAATTTYFVTATDINGCQGTDSVKVSINALPTLAVATPAAMCSGQSTNLSASGASTYAWSPATGLSATNIANPIANPSATTTYTVNGIDANGCTGTTTVTVNINPLPAISAGSDVAFCKGNSTTLNATGGTTYSWSPVAGLSNPNIANPVAAPLFTTTYTVTGTDANGCQNTSSVKLTVNPLSTVDAGNDVTLCNGQSTALNASGGNTYSWTPAAGLSSTTIPNPTANPAATTTYFVTATDINGCQGTDSVKVSINALPTLAVATPAAMCSGQSTNLSASGASTYAWSPATGLSATNIANPLANPSATTTYTVNGIDANGCTGTTTVTVNINPLPAISAGSDVAFCEGNSTTLKAAGATTYSWSPVAGLSNPNIANPVAAPLATTNYTVTGTDANGCQNTSSMTVTINPTPAVNAGSDAVICFGNSASLSAVGANTYSWTPAVGLSATNISNPSASPSLTTSYVVTGTDAVGCKGTDTVNVTVNYISVKAFSDTTFCLGGSKQLNATGGQTYSWTPSVGLTNSNISNPVATPLVSTTYKVDVTDINGCKNSDSVKITVNQLPVASAGADQSYCAGSTAQLNATGGGTYSWSPSAGLSSAAVSNPVANPISTTNYVVTVTDINGCVDKDTVQVKVNPLPIADAGNDTTFCLGNSAMLIASGGTNYAWSPAAGLSATNIANPVAHPLTTTTYAVTVTDANNCSKQDSVKVTITYISISVSANDTICTGTNAQLNASGGTTYLWSPATGLSSTSAANPVATPVSNTTYSVLVQDANGCQNTGQTTVLVNPKPAFDAGPDLSFCNGKNGVINATGTGSVIWTPAAGLSSTSVLQPVASPAATTKYFGTLTDANGCQNTDSVKVNVNFITVTKSKDTTVCSGISTQLSASGGSNYLWTPAAGLNNTSSANPIATPLATTTYYVNVTDVNGCKNSDSIHVSVNALPIVAAGKDTSICNGNTVQLNASGGNTYSWSPSAGLSNTNISNPTASPVASTDYIVTGTDAKGCAAKDTVTVKVTFINVSVSKDTSICAGHNANLNASGGVAYSWTPAATLSAPASAATTASPLATTNYSVTVTDINGCKNTASVKVNVNFISTTISNDTTLCAGTSTTLKSTGGVSYTWAPTTGLSNAGISNPVATPLATTKYGVTVKDVNGCQKTDSVKINVNALPLANAGKDTSLCDGHAAQLNANGGVTYAWSPAAGLSNTSIANPIASPTVPTNYVVAVTGANGCVKNDTAFVNVTYISVKTNNDTTICAGQPVQMSSSGGIKYQWSPATGLSDATISNPLATPSDSTKYQLTVTDANGCKNTVPVNIYVHHIPTAFAGNDVSICLGKTDTLKATGGTIYAWSPSTGLSNASISNPVASPSATTSYIVKVSDGIGCSTQDTVKVNVTISVIGSAFATPATFCPGQPITLKAAPGNGVLLPANPFSFDGGKTFQKADSLILSSVGQDSTAFVIIRDQNGCQSDSINLVLKEKVIKGNPLVLTPASCSLQNNGVGKLANASGGTSPYSFGIDAGTMGTDSVFTALASGSHQISVKDAQGCSAVFSLNITQQASITSKIAKTDPVCSGDSTGQITITASGGSGLGFTYALDNGKYQATNTFSKLKEGLHTIVIKDAVSCYDTVAVVISTPNPVSIDVSSTTNLICNGNNTGKIQLDASGGTPNYVYSLGGILFQPSPDFSNLAKGKFTAVVKDANGCIDSSTVFLFEPDTLSAKINITQVPLCNGVLGEIQLSNLAGGTPGYLKGIDGKAPGVSNTFSNLLPGTHVIKIVDKNGCTRSYDKILPGDPNSISGNVSIDSITCTTGNNGDIHLTNLTGGQRPFQFSLNNQLNFQDDSSFSNLKKGLYTIYAKNANSCLSQFVVNVIDPSPIQTVLISETDITCYGLKDGAISIQAIGGNKGYTYQLPPSAFVGSGVFTSLAPGKDTILIKDVKGCQSTYPFEITQPDSILATVIQTNPAECSVADGEAKITTIQGGTGTFKFSINGGLIFQTDSTFRFLKSGSYNLLLKDAAGCQNSTTFIVNQKGGGLDIAAVKKSITDLSCNNANIGTVSLSNLIGGKAPYIFAIDTISASKTDSSFNGLGAGVHTVHITDNAGCNYDIGFTISQPQPINFELSISKVESCNSGNGTITVSNVTGGNTVYLYSIDNKPFQDSLVFGNVAGGLHNIEVKDSSVGSCHTSKPIYMNKKPVPDATLNTSDPICYDYNNGFMVIDTVVGGQGPYTYSLDGVNFQAATEFDNMKADTFSLYIKDSECPNAFIDPQPVYTYAADSSITDTAYVNYFVLHQPDSISAETFTIPADRSSTGGIFGFFKLQGGHGPYFYSLDSINYSPVVNDTTVIQNLASGDYFVYIKDSRACPQELKIYLGKNLFVPNLVTPNGDGKNDYFEVTAIKNNSKLVIVNKWGSRVYYSTDYDNSWNGEGLPDGIYYYDLEINGGKKIKGWVEILR